MEDSRPLEHDQTICRRRNCCDFAMAVDAQDAMTQLFLVGTFISNDQQHREVASLVEIVVVMPSDVVTRSAVHEDGKRTLIAHGRWLDPRADCP